MLFYNGFIQMDLICFLIANAIGSQQYGSIFSKPLFKMLFCKTLIFFPPEDPQMLKKEI